MSWPECPQFDQFFHNWSDDLHFRHILAGKRPVIDRLSRAVQIPLTGLVEQFPGVFDVGGQRNLHAFLLPRLSKVWLEHGNNSVVALALDTLHLTARVTPHDLVTELDVVLIPPIGHLRCRRCVAILAMQLRTG